MQRPKITKVCHLRTFEKVRLLTRTRLDMICKRFIGENNGKDKRGGSRNR